MPPHDHQLPWVSSRDAQVYAAAPFRYSAAIAPGHLSLLPDLLEELVTHFQILRLEEREALLQLLLPWLRALAVACADENGESLGTTVPLSDGGEQQPQRPTTPSARRGNARQMMSQVLKLLLSLSRLTKLQPGAASSGTAQSAHLAFLVEAAWAAVVSEASTPLLVPSLVELLLQSHVTAAAAQPVDVGEMELCSRVLLLVCRTPCVPQILSHLLSHLRHYDEQHCPPSDDAASWLVWRMRMPAARQPLSAVELSVIPMLAQLPYEQHNQLPPHLPLLLHTLCVCFAPEARSALSNAPDASRAVGEASSLLQPLLSNLAPRGEALQGKHLTQGRLLLLLRRASVLRPDLAAVRPLAALLSPLSAGLQSDWRRLALHWAVHATDPDLSLTSLRVFAQLSDAGDVSDLALSSQSASSSEDASATDLCNPELLRTLILTLWGALRDGATAKVQLLLRLLRRLPANHSLPLSCWLDLTSVAAALLSSHCESLYHESLQLLMFILHSSGDARLLSQPVAEAAPSSARSGGEVVRVGDSYTCPPLSELLSHIDLLWRADVPSSPTSKLVGSPESTEEGNRLDKAIVARLMKGVTIGAEVSEACRASSLSCVETFAVCYADHLPPNNELAMTSLLVHALGVLSHNAANSPREAANAAKAASLFLQRNGSAIAERLVELFNKCAVTGEAKAAAAAGGSSGKEAAPALVKRISELDPEAAASAGDLTRQSSDPALPKRTSSSSSDRERNPSQKRRSSRGEGSAPSPRRSGGGGSRGRRGDLTSSGGSARDLSASGGGGGGGGTWGRTSRIELEEAAAFAEKFFEGFALAFSSEDNVDFVVSLLTSWLAEASRPLVEPEIFAAPPTPTLRQRSRRSLSSDGGGFDNRSFRSRAESLRSARAHVASLLRLLTAFMLQYAPSDVSPRHFVSLAPRVIAHFSRNLDGDVSRSAERLLAEMVARAPPGTPEHLFSLVDSKGSAAAIDVSDPNSKAATADASSAELMRPASPGGVSLPWEPMFVEADDPAGFGRMHLCAERVQSSALRVASSITTPSVSTPSSSASSSIDGRVPIRSSQSGEDVRLAVAQIAKRAWPTDLPRASTTTLPTVEPQPPPLPEVRSATVTSRSSEHHSSNGGSHKHASQLQSSDEEEGEGGYVSGPAPSPLRKAAEREEGSTGGGGPSMRLSSSSRKEDEMEQRGSRGESGGGSSDNASPTPPAAAPRRSSESLGLFVAQHPLELLREDDGDMLDDEEDEGEELNLMVGIDDVSDLEDDDEEEEDSAGTLRGVIGVEV